MVEKIIYPIKYMRITQHYNGSNNHYKHSGGSPKDYPIDDGAQDTGSSPFYAPCKVKVVRIYGVGASGVNTLWLTSVNKVQFADGTLDYATFMVEHCPDSSLKKLKIGQVFNTKEQICTEGSDQASGAHFHLSAGKGTIKGNGWTKNNKGSYVLTTTGGTMKPERVYFVDNNFTKILDDDGIDFKTLTSTNNKEGGFMAKSWKNGSSKEPVYQTIGDCKNKKNSIGSLSANETATCVAVKDGCYLVMYSAGGTTKCGFVSYSGGVKA